MQALSARLLSFRAEQRKCDERFDEGLEESRADYLRLRSQSTNAGHPFSVWELDGVAVPIWGR